MNKFDNTYINVSGKSPDEIYALAKKYSEASGIEINSDDVEEGCFKDEWEYLSCGIEGDPSYADISVIDKYVIDKHLPENPKQITEEDLDNYLKQKEKTVKTTQELPEEFVIIDADTLAVRQWLKDLGYDWITGDDLTQYDLELSTLACCYEDCKMTHASLDYYKEFYPNLPIITPKTGVTGFDISYPTPEKPVKEVAMENIEKQLAEIQETLKKLKEGGE